jgi:ABC-2 type transport system permease protein
MTYAVEPVRSVVFDRLNVSPEARAILDPGILWGSFSVPVWMQAGIVVLASAVLVSLAVAFFSRTE